MKISEILFETIFDSKEHSDKKWIMDETLKLNTAIKNFDIYVQVYGTKGANVKFDEMIHNVNESEWYFNFLTTNKPEMKKYRDRMLDSKKALEEKIKNSGGLSY